MKYGKLLIVPLFVACFGPAKAGADLDYAIETSRFDFVLTFDSQNPPPATGLNDENPSGSLDVIVCNQSMNMGKVVDSQGSQIVAPMRCLVISDVKDLKAVNGAPQPWHGILYGRFGKR